MGAFFTNYHIETKSIKPEQITEAIIAFQRQAGYTYQPDAAQTDCTVYLLYKPGARWAVFCEKGPDGSALSDIKAVARSYAGLLHTNVVGSLVFDSSLLMNYLHSAVLRKGDLVIRPNDAISREEFGFGRGSGKGRPGVWREALGCDEAALKTLWETDIVFAEDMLAEIGKLLGFEDTACCAAEDVAEGRVPPGYTRVVLTFTAPEPKKPSYDVITEGPVRFEVKMISDRFFWNQMCSAHFINRGGPDTGAAVYMESDLFSGEDLVLTEAELVRKPDGNTDPSLQSAYGDIRQRAPFQKTKREQGRRV